MGLGTSQVLSYTFDTKGLATLYLEEFAVGDRFILEPITLTEEEIYSFAEKYDPQLIHLDPEFAAQGLFKGIIASGFHTVSAVWGQWIRANIMGKENLGGTIDFLRFLAPVRPNDQLHTTAEVVEKIPSSKENRVLVAIKLTVTNQNQKAVLETQCRVIIKGRS